MKKIILNKCFGGFGWSDAATKLYAARTGKFLNSYSWEEDERMDPGAVAMLEEMGSEFCSGDYARLEIEEFDDDLFIPMINEYDGSESLELSPNLSEARIRACKDMDAVIDLLRKTRVIA